VALLGNVVDRVVGDVLADPLVAAAAQPHDRRQPLEIAERDLQPFELDRVDLHRQPGDRVVGGHRDDPR
jgi:hypothetical protein